MIKPIDTIYNGYKFRSRLEARWAVFFDTLNIPYEYEVQGYDMNGTWYLPDFWMPTWNCWLEIKPEIPNLRDSNKIEYLKCAELAKEKDGIVLLVGGNPWAKTEVPDCNYFSFEYGIAVFSSNPITNKKNKENENYLGIKINFLEGNKLEKKFYNNILYPFLKENNLCSTKKISIQEMIKKDNDYYLTRYNKANPNWIYGISCDNLNFNFQSNVMKLEENLTARYKQNKKLIHAYETARQARFEKGR